MKKAEYPGNGGCPQRDSAEHEEYAGARSIGKQEREGSTPSRCAIYAG